MDIDAYLERRAAELAAPLIDKAKADAADLARRAKDEVNRQRDLVTELRRQLKGAHHRIDRQVERGDRLTEQLRIIRALQAMWADLGVLGTSDRRGVYARVAEDLGEALTQPGDQSRRPK